MDKVEITDIYEMDPEKLTKEHVDQVVAYHRENREKFAIEETTKARSKSKAKTEPAQEGSNTFDDV